MDAKTKKTYQKIFGWAENSERPGGEFDWFAVDKDDSVAAFSTAGFGPVPDVVFEIGLDAYLGLVDFIENALAHTSSLHSGGFTPYSERGIFVFDFRASESGQYELASAPIDPIKFEQLEKLGIDRGVLPRFQSKFAEMRTVIPEEHWTCR
ncbi:hypothetical protein [Stieleria tagensis]|uniref:hypothetical protein n=1 Tax=Stieleria tagensis TaxID=2956795 RepID=UPI00209A9B84|nr:hypothetical protein [Stieleria tagensis]